MKKIFLIIFVLLFIGILIAPLLTKAAFNPSTGIVQCGNPGQNPCQIQDFFTMLGTIYDFLVKWIATPLAILALTIGGIILLTSAGNPNQQGTGKKVVWLAIIGLALVWASWLIIHTLLITIGYKYPF